MVSHASAPIAAILQFIVSDLLELLVGHGFRIVDSLVSTSNGGDAYVELATATIVIRLSSDRGQCCILVRSPDEKPYKYFDGHSIDIIRRLLGSKYTTDDASMNEENGKFLCEAAIKMKDLFSKGKLSATLKAIHGLELERSKRMFPSARMKSKKSKPGGN